MKFQAGPEAPRLPTEGTLRAKNSATLPRPGPMTPRYSTRRQATMMRREPAQERIFSGLFERRQVRAGSRGLQLYIPASDCHQNAARTFPEAFGFAETPATEESASWDIQPFLNSRPHKVWPIQDIDDLGNRFLR